MQKRATPLKKKFGSRKKRKPDYDQNDGVSGVVYILINPGLAYNYIKIGCSRHSGNKRALQLNKAVNTGTPGQYRCAFEQKTVDCGLAEKRVHERLKKYRAATHKVMQEFFCIDFGVARKVIIEECARIDLEKRVDVQKKLNDKQDKLASPKPPGARPLVGRYDILKSLHTTSDK